MCGASTLSKELDAEIGSDSIGEVQSITERLTSCQGHQCKQPRVKQDRI